jgi:outer membrane immunogenic protein
MKGTIYIAAIAALIGTPALAADMAAKTPPPAPQAPEPAPVYSWTGFYVGGSLGLRWSDRDWTTTSGNGLGSASLVPSSISLDSTTARGGGYLGYNWQTSSWLVGLEGDIAWADKSKSNAGIPGLCFSGGVGPSCTVLDNVTVKEGWDASLRGRVGFLVTPAWLVYATGGAAWQQISISASCNGTNINNSFCGIVLADSSSTVRTGWTIGGGVEVMLSSNWVARAEYRYADFGSIGFTFPPAPSTGFTSNVSLKTNTALLGFGYKF